MLCCSIVPIPPRNSVTAWPERSRHTTVPEWNVWLCVVTETAFIFTPTSAQSNFQLSVPQGDPSVRAMYTCRRHVVHPKHKQLLIKI